MLHILSTLANKTKDRKEKIPKFLEKCIILFFINYFKTIRFPEQILGTEDGTADL